MKNIKTLLAGLALAAGIFAPVTAFAADDEFAVATEETVFSIPVDENAVVVTTEETAVEETVEEVAVEETVEAAAETTVEETVETTEEVATPVVEEVVASDIAVEETADEVVEETPVETVEETVEEVVETTEEVAVEETEEVVAPVVEEVVASDATEEEAVEEVVTEEVVEASNVAVLADVAETETETVKGEQVGAINRGYAKMDDGSDAFCVEVEKEHIEEDVEYVREDDVDGSSFNSVFVARANALCNGMDEFTVNSITQLAVWNKTSGTDYTDLVDFYYGQEGVELYNQMLNTYEGEWSFKYWMYTPNLDTFQRLLAGQAIKTPVEPETPEQPEQPEEPETPVEPEIPDVPETPVVPDEPVVPVTPETPSTPDEPVVETPIETPVQEVEVLSETFVNEEQPVVEASVPVLSQRMYQTGDESNVAGRMIVILAAFAAVALLVKKENN